MRTSPQTRLTFRFEGGDADAGQLNFYEAARFQYGAARFVYTLEYFRQTGMVLYKITRRVNADYRVPTPRSGSWILDVVQIAVPILGEMALKVPIEVLMAYVVERLIPGRRSREMAGEIIARDRPDGGDRIALERERTAQEHQRTEQIRLLTDTNSKALNLLEKELGRRRDDSPTVKLLSDIQGELVASSEREMVVENYKTELDKIDDHQMDSLLNRTRTQVIEIGKPLISSADRLEIGEVSRAKAFVSLNRRSIERQCYT